MRVPRYPKRPLSIGEKRRGSRREDGGIPGGGRAPVADQRDGHLVEEAHRPDPRPRDQRRHHEAGAEAGAALEMRLLAFAGGSEPEAAHAGVELLEVAGRDAAGEEALAALGQRRRRAPGAVGLEQLDLALAQRHHGAARRQVLALVLARYLGAEDARVGRRRRGAVGDDDLQSIDAFDHTGLFVSGDARYRDRAAAIASPWPLSLGGTITG